jgi:starch phosphorylase
MQGVELGRALRSWEQVLSRHWQEIHWGNLTVKKENTGWIIEVQTYLGSIPREFVQIQLYAQPKETDKGFFVVMQQGEPIAGSVNGYSYRTIIKTSRPAEDFTPRVVPYHPQAQVPTELPLIHWQR